MNREQRVSLWAFLLFFIFGLSSYFSLGDFVTPHFFGKLVAVLLSFIFLFRNLLIHQSFILYWASLAMIARALMDDFSVYFLAEKMNSIAFIDFVNQSWVIYLSFFVFFGFYATAIYFLAKVNVNRWLIILLILLFLSSILALAYVKGVNWELLFGGFLFTYFIVVQYTSLPYQSVISIISALFIFQVAVESLKYLYQ